MHNTRIYCCMSGAVAIRARLVSRRMAQNAIGQYLADDDVSKDAKAISGNVWFRISVITCQCLNRLSPVLSF